MADNRLARLLNEILIYKYPNSIQKVADHLGETYNYVHQQTYARCTPHVKVIRAAYLITQDPRLKKELEPDGYELVPAKSATALKDTESELTDVVLEVSTAIDQLRKALEDQQIDKDERLDIEKTFGRIRKQLLEAEVSFDELTNKKRLKAIK